MYHYIPSTVLYQLKNKMIRQQASEVYPEFIYTFQ